MDRGYPRLSRAIAGERLPLALVDLAAFDANAEALIALARAHDKGLRVATKSLRVPALLRRLLDAGARGLMCYSAAEARHLYEAHGLDDLLVAYPTLQPADLDDLLAISSRGAQVSLVVDSAAHVEAAAARASAISATLGVVIEMDVSLRAMGLRLGALRSPIHEIPELVALAERIARTPGLRFDGVMAYEAHVAGLPDRSPIARWQNPVKRALKLASKGPVERARAEVRAALEAKGLAPKIMNGGGSGNLAWCVREPALTEVAAGSGFLDGHLFDGYRDMSFRPALLFALQVTRRPSDAVVTAHGGGYVASGGISPDRLPIPWAPAGLSLTEIEGAGEVQTPILGGASLKLGDPVFFRPAKSGELAERFDEYLLVDDDRVVDRVRTYRGEGRVF